MDADVVVVGAGIVGSAVAGELAASGRRILVLDAGTEALVGSTGHAPGFIGEFGGAPVATELAQLTTAGLDRLAATDPWVFARTGCVEVATTEHAGDALRSRAAQATAQGLAVREIDPDHAAQLAPETIPADRVTAAIHFPRDATTEAGRATERLRAQAQSLGARFTWGVRVREVRHRADRVELVTAGGRSVAGREVVLCTGIWGTLGTPSSGGVVTGTSSPIVAVRHPYVHGPRVAGPAQQRPFVRFPEHHVYARWHGSRWGFGSYDHAPDPVDARGLVRADLEWDGRFDEVVERGLRLFARPELFVPTQRLDGVFAMTPDNLPLIGRWDERIWLCAAVWVTHSIGAAQVLAALLADQPASVTEYAALDPRRFDSWSPEIARAAALSHYNDIYERG